ncbi:MAG TPA: tetratricopeptide repeat protein, partial [Candidatus Marinimicrobia bacterium]|nr:tetratricopeptide repeat protein [Candidatus Neomarinimicrobiota bacterium]
MLGQSKIKIPLLLWMFLTITIYSCGKKEAPKESEALVSLIEARNLGLAYLEENRLDEAEAQFIIMTENAPDDAMGHANLGLIYLRKSDFAKAEKAVQQALRLSSEDSDINLILAEVYDAVERDEEAIEILKKSLSTSPGHLRSIYKIIDIYSKMAYARPEDQAVTANREGYL